MLHARVEADERALSLMLRHWRASTCGEPMAVYDRGGTLLGLAPECAIGDRPRIIIRVTDITDDDATGYRPASSS